MGRNTVSSAESRHQGRGHGLKVVARGQKLYLYGTLRVHGSSNRIRRSTGLDCRSDENWELAEAIRIKTERQLLDQVVHGIPPSTSFARVVKAYIRARNQEGNGKPGAADLRNLTELIDAFGELQISQLTGTDIRAFYDRRFAGLSAATRRRHENTLNAVLVFAGANGYLASLPTWQRTPVRSSKKQGRNSQKYFLPGEAELLIDCAAPHLKPIMACLYVTGARVGQTVNLKKVHFRDLARRGLGSVHFPDTKNDNAYTRPLHDYAVAIITEWLKSRDDGHPEMFLTNCGKPYLRRRGSGGQITTGFKTARERCVTRMKEMGLHDRAAVMAEATPHWFRHNFANTLKREAGMTDDMIAEAGMWKSVPLVRDVYIDSPSEHIEQQVRAVSFGQGQLKGPRC